MRTAFVIIALSFVGAAAPSLAAAAPPATESSADRVLVNRDRTGLALQGFDPVAYFTDGKPVLGSASFASTHDGATYRFASIANKAMFDAEPDRYAPAFGGYCGYAASINRLSPIDPSYFQILDGRLVLQHNQKAWDAWNKDVPGNLEKADANWPGLVARNGAAIKLLVNLNDEGVAIQGYDPVAYFPEGGGAPQKGSPAHMAVYDGATYWFVSDEHRVIFEQSPATYAPQFGGYCAYAASINKVSPINPEIWQLENGRLLLQHTDDAYRRFNKNPERNLQKADRNWPGLVKKHGR